MGEPVLADAQFGIVKTLRPFPGFEAVYNGQSVQKPILFSEQGKPLDPLAGSPGYAPNLVSGLSVPLGSRVVIQLPTMVAVKTDLTVIPYDWFITWRLRNTFDFRQRRIPFHLGKQGAGVPDTTTPPNTARVVVPAIHQAVVYNQPEPTGATARSIQNIRIEDVSPRAEENLSLPLLPGGTPGIYQQGLLDPATSPGLAPFPLFIVHEVEAVGDEMILGVYRSSDNGAHPNWEFTTPPKVDIEFSILFGNGSGQVFPDIGVYVSTGASVP